MRSGSRTRHSVTSLPKTRVRRADPVRQSARLASRTHAQAVDESLAEMEAAIGMSQAALTPSPLGKFEVQHETVVEDDLTVSSITPTLSMRMSVDVSKELQSIAHQGSTFTQSPSSLSLVSDLNLSDTDDERPALSSPGAKSPKKPTWALDEMPQPSPGWEVIPAHRRSGASTPVSPGLSLNTTHLKLEPTLSASPQPQVRPGPASPSLNHRPRGSPLSSVHSSPLSSPQPKSKPVLNQGALSSPSGAILSTVPISAELKSSLGWQHSSMRLSTDRLDSIFSFLDEVDQSCELQPAKPAAGESKSVEASSSTEAVAANDGYNYGARMGEMYGGVKAKMDTMKQELAQQAQRIDCLQLEIQQKEETRNAERKAMLEEHEKHLEDVRGDLEGAIGRNLEFIDRLLSDKEELNTKCTELTQQITEVEGRWVSKMKSFEEECQRQMAQAKAQRDATEQLRRNKWQAAKEKEIKEITIKGLEPEVERMLAKHKSDLAAAVESHEEAVRAVREEEALKFEEGIRKERNRHRDEVDMAIERERSMASEQLRQNSLRHEGEMAAQRQRLLDEFQGDATHKESAWRDRTRGHEETIAALRRELEETRENAKRELRRELGQLREAHEHEMEEQQHRYRLDRAEYKQSMRAELQGEFDDMLKKKLEELTAQLTRERDEEIEMVIQRLEQETRSQVQAEEGRNAAAVAQGEKLAQEARDKEQEWMSRYKEEVAARARLEDENRTLDNRLTSANAQMETLLAKQQGLSDELHQERIQAHSAQREAEDAARKQRTAHECEVIAFKKTVLERESQLKTLQRENHEAIAAISKANADELERVNTRVRQAIEKKDEVITRLRQQLTATERQALQIETLLHPSQ